MNIVKLFRLTNPSLQMVLVHSTSRRPRYKSSIGNGIESLEDRRLLAATPQLIGSQLFADNQSDQMGSLGGVLFFNGSDQVHGRELWKSDGTVGGTVLVKDIYTGTYPIELGGAGINSSPYEFTNSGGTLFFSATDAEHGRELWKTDGTEVGTALVKDINTQSDQYGGPGNGYPDYPTDVNGTLFFRGNDGSDGNNSLGGFELWKSDGNEAGTVQVKGLPGSKSLFPGELTNVGGTLFFNGANALWKSDGTEEGTTQVLSNNLTGNPRILTNANGTLFFTGFGGINGAELWKTDGTAEGTLQVKDIKPGSSGSVPSSLIALDGSLFFTAETDSNGRELWKSDGTADGTILVKDINAGISGSEPRTLTNVNDKLFFFADDGIHGN